MGINRIVAIVLTLGVGGSLLTSCGDDTEALSKPEFVEQADTICRATNDEMETVFDEVYEGFDDADFDDPATQELMFVRFDEAMDQVEPMWNRQLDELRDLAPPEEDQDLIETLFDDFEEVVAEFAELIAAAADGDEAARANVNDEDNDPFFEIDRRARDYGLVACGDPG